HAGSRPGRERHPALRAEVLARRGRMSAVGTRRRQRRSAFHAELGPWLIARATARTGGGCSPHFHAGVYALRLMVLASYNIKGGVGKTSAAVNLAYLAARGGASTLPWDLDPPGAGPSPP